MDTRDPQAEISPLTVDGVIDRCGGSRAVEEALGMARGSLRKWRQFGFVPEHRVLFIAEMADIAVGSIPRDPKRPMPAEREAS